MSSQQRHTCISGSSCTRLHPAGYWQGQYSCPIPLLCKLPCKLNEWKLCMLQQWQQARLLLPSRQQHTTRGPSCTVKCKQCGQDRLLCAAACPIATCLPGYQCSQALTRVIAPAAAAASAAIPAASCHDLAHRSSAMLLFLALSPSSGGVWLLPHHMTEWAEGSERGRQVDRQYWLISSGWPGGQCSCHPSSVAGVPVSAPHPLPDVRRARRRWSGWHCQGDTAGRDHLRVLLVWWWW